MASRSTRPRPPVALTIAASDSGGGAGIQADLLAFAAHGVYGATVLTAGTAQNTRGVTAIEPFSTLFIRRQMDAVFPDLRPAAVKIGMLYDGARAREVGRGLRRHGARRVVLDPVMVSKSGAALLDPSAIRALRALFPLCELVTPNLPEAEVLSGIEIRDASDRRRAAGILAGLGASAILVKGGHGRGSTVSDFLFDGRRSVEIEHPRIPTRATHGTGCTLSAAIAARFALGGALEESVRAAIRYLEAGLAEGLFPGKGWGTPDRFPAAGGVTPRRRTRIPDRGTRSRRPR